MNPNLRIAPLVGVLCLATGVLTPAFADESWSARCGNLQPLPIIDAHSQFDHEVSDRTVLARMRENGVIATILATRGRREPTDAADLADRYPSQIVAAASTKQRRYDPLSIVANRRFFSVAEILLYHARKGDRAPEVREMPDSPAMQELLRKIAESGRPLVLHIEFRALPRDGRLEYAGALKEVLKRWTNTPVGLIHMGQLDAREAATWLREHPNLFFLTSHADPVAVNRSRQPWTNMFSGDELQAEWKELVQRYPDRFVFALDNVWAEHWNDEYAERIALWRKALGRLPESIARQIACGNAVRIWRLGEPSKK